MTPMRLVYIYHSGFVLETDRFALLIDYYRDTCPDGGFVHTELLRRAGTIYVLASHFHPDHFNPEVLSWREERPDIRYIFSRDILRRRRARAEDALYLRKGEVYADDDVRIKAFGSTDVGISFLIETEGKRIFHAGDLNNWHWQDESTPQEVAQAEGNFLKELEALAAEAPRLDLALFPVDPRIGSDFARGARQFVERIPTRMLVPMHFWERPEEVRGFAPVAEANGCRYVTLAEPGMSLEIE